MAGSVEEILKYLGPSLSSTVKDEIRKDGSVSDENARQRISRARGDVCRLNTIKLPKNERFLYLKSQFGSEEYWERLLAALTTTRSAYGVAFQSIAARNYIVPKNHFHIISGSPLKLKNHPGSQNILNGLIRSKILTIEDRSDGRELVVPSAELSPLYYDEIKSNDYDPRSVVEELLASTLTNWLKKTGLGSYGSIKNKTEDSAPQFGQFKWDITAPSYLFPLARQTTNKREPGFIVIDYVVGSQLSEIQVEYFIRKCKTLRSIKSISPFLAILIADSFSNEAFKRGKQEGLMFSTPEILFGRETAEGLRELLATLKNAAVVSISNPKKIPELFNKLSAIEGASINLRGALFELIVAHLVYKKQGGSVDIGVTLTNFDNGKKADVDVRLVEGDHKVTIIECKARNDSRKITVENIKHWIDDRVPLIRECLLKLDQFKNRDEIHFEYWTTGTYEDDALALLKAKKASLRKYSIDWKDGSAVLKYSQAAKSTTMSKLLKEHFLKHPLNCK